MRDHQRKPDWLKDVNKALDAYRRVPGGDGDSQEEQAMNTLLDRVEEKIRDTKHDIRRCRHEHIWIPALLQEPEAPKDDGISIPRHSLDIQHRYEKTLQEYKRRLDHYERVKTELHECLHSEQEQ